MSYSSKGIEASHQCLNIYCERRLEVFLSSAICRRDCRLTGWTIVP